MNRLSTDLVDSLEEALPALKEGNISLWAVDHHAPRGGFRSLLDDLENVSDEPLPDRPQVNIMSNFLFIFTSGTTGNVLSVESFTLTSCFNFLFISTSGPTVWSPRSELRGSYSDLPIPSNPSNRRRSNLKCRLPSRNGNVPLGYRPGHPEPKPTDHHHTVIGLIPRGDPRRCRREGGGHVVEGRGGLTSV